MTDFTATPAAPRSDKQSRTPRRSRGPGAWLVVAALAALLLVFMFPFLLALINAIKTPADYAAHGAIGVPQSFSLDALVTFWQNVDFTRKLINSTLLSACVAVFGTLLSMLNAYAIGIGRLKGGNALLVLLLIGLMIPQEALVYPLYIMAKSTHLFDSLLACIIVFSVLQSTFGTYLLSSVLSQFPTEIIEAAKVDGANSWQVLWFIVVPVMRSTLGVLATFFFIWTWNEFLLPLVLLVSNDNQTVSVAMGVLSGQFVSEPTSIAAAALLGMGPTVIFFLIFQRTLTRGVTVGAIK
jgi:raffinose/stachyose/melibiose transport system permease protein